MLDNQLITLIIQTLINGESIAGIPGTPIKAAFQPTLQGINTKPTGYLYIIGDELIGNVDYSNVWDKVKSVMIHTEMQQIATTLQLSALATQNPLTPNQYTAKDIVRLMASILRSQSSVAAFEAQGVGIQNIKMIRNPYFLDDRQQNEASPSFDFIMTHKQIIVSTMPIVQSITIQEFSI